MARPGTGDLPTPPDHLSSAHATRYSDVVFDDLLDSGATWVNGASWVNGATWVNNEHTGRSPFRERRGGASCKHTALSVASRAHGIAAPAKLPREYRQDTVSSPPNASGTAVTFFSSGHVVIGPEGSMPGLRKYIEWMNQDRRTDRIAYMLTGRDPLKNIATPDLKDVFAEAIARAAAVFVQKKS